MKTIQRLLISAALSVACLNIRATLEDPGHPAVRTNAANHGESNVPRLRPDGSLRQDGFRLLLEGEDAEPCWLDASSDLNVWISIATVIHAAPLAGLHDPSASRRAMRFYRARTGPVTTETVGERWRAQRISSYQFRFQKVRFGPIIAATVRVRDQKIVAVTDVVSTDILGGELPPERAVGEALSIEQMLDLAVSASAQKPHLLTIEYDPELGYPRNIHIDPDGSVTDEEASYHATELVRLP